LDCVVNFTPTGMIPTKKMTPHIPISPAEIVEDIHAALEIGITMVHLHARDPLSGEPAYKSEIYGDIISGIRQYSKDLVICVSLSGRTFSEFEKRSEPLDLGRELKPDMGSLTLSSMNFNREPSLNSPELIQALAGKMNRLGIMPELEAFDAGMINYVNYLEKRGFLEPPYYFNLIFGNIACAQADLLHAGVLLRDLPHGSMWSFGGVGDFQLMMNSIAIAAGGGVRVGLEDNIWYDRARTRLARNIDLVRRVRTLAEANERKIMPPAELRKLLNLEKGHGFYGRQHNEQPG
jgi:3-keto-5-aminohexanoate cleavage enzyme